MKKLARGSHSAKPSHRQTFRNAFLNIPYDSQYEDLYVAFIAGLCRFGLTPRATLEITSSRRRLERIAALIRSCRYSFHDLSRVELDSRPTTTPRFNMPFELGLAVAHSKSVGARHERYVFEARPHRLKKSLSDLDGTDPLIHRASTRGVLRELTNALMRTGHQPSLEELSEAYKELRRMAMKMKQGRGGGSLFEAHPFRGLVLAANEIAGRQDGTRSAS